MKNIDKITNYLLFESEDVFILGRPNLKRKGRTKILGPKEDPNLDPLMTSGFADAAKVNKTYKELLCNLGINDLSNNELMKEWWREFRTIRKGDTESERTGSILFENISMSSSTKTMILKLRLLHKWSINSIWAKFRITKEELNKLFSELK